MLRIQAIAVVLAFASSSLGGEVRLDDRVFHLPDGFTIERVAGPPLVDRPIVADFDERGRLYVADSSGSNDKVEKQLEEKPHRIVRLEDSDGDGKFDRRTIFADKMMFPEGAMWFDGSLYTAAPPSIWKLTDTDGDGVADRREEWFKGKTLTGCANDLHGPYLGPDGWIYWCKGAFAKQTYERPGKPDFVTRASHIFRARPDGTGIEPVMTGGMDNPVDVVFTREGERIFTTTFLQHPSGGRRDGLIHAIYGGVYGKVHDVLDDHVWTGPDIMPVMTHLGPAAPAGLVRYESETFGPEYRDNLFACLFNMHKVTRHVLRESGSTFATDDSDFVVCDSLDFHPTDVIEDADGSLLIIDTGGWYKLCCPTSQLHKPDVLGAIYRVRKAGMPRVDDPRGSKLAWSKMTSEELTDRLDDPRPAVKRQAIERLAKHERALHALALAMWKGKTIERRRNALWALIRSEDEDARTFINFTLALPNLPEARVALQAASLGRVPGGSSQDLAAHLNEGPARQRRLAAEAMGRMKDKSAVLHLLHASSRADDRALEHALTYALIEIGDAKATAVGLNSENAATRRIALTALDQMDGKHLRAEQVGAELTSTDTALRETAVWIAGRHPEWGDALVGRFKERLTSDSLDEVERAELERQLARLARSEAIQAMLVDVLDSEASPSFARRSALRTMAEARLKTTPDAWIKALSHALAADDPDRVRSAIAAARAVSWPKDDAEGLATALLTLARSDGLAAEARLQALAAPPKGPGAIDGELAAFLFDRLKPDVAVAERMTAADILSRSRLTTEQLGTLADLLGKVGPMEAEKLLGAFQTATDDEVGRRVVAALKGSATLAGLRADTLKTRLASFGPEVRREVEGLIAPLNVDAAGQKARLDELASSLPMGDVRRGQIIFNGTKAACATCHAIGYLGGKLGPDLTRIGGVRNDRDLLESIVFPSASFVRSFEPVVVATHDGRVLSGLVRKDADDEMVVATSATDEARVARSDIEEVRPGTVSIMPAGLDRQLTAQELADLLAFLKASK